MKPTVVKVLYNGAIATFSGLTDDLRGSLRRELTYTDYAKVYEAQTSNNSQSTTVCLFGNDLIPAGLLPRASALLRSLNVELDISNQVKKIEPEPYQLPDWLRSYQKQAIKIALVNPKGIIQIPTGGGKSITAAQLIKMFPQAKVLFTVPRIKLALQAKEVLQTQLGEEVGLLGDGTFDWRRVTVGVINSLVLAVDQKDPNLAEINICIHDEVHYAGSQSYLKLALSLTQQHYTIGLSATPQREDGCNLAMEAVCGPIIFKVTEAEVAKLGAINMPSYFQISVPDRYLQERKPYPRVGTPVQHHERLRLYKYAITNNSNRNALVLKLVELILNLPERQGNLLVMFDYIEHGELLQNLLAAKQIYAPIMHGKTPKKEGKTILSNFTENKIPILLGSNVFKDGVDLPNLEFLIQAGSRASATTHWQKIGRALRTNADYVKDQSIVIDLADSDPFFSPWSRKRAQAVKERYTENSFQSCTDFEEFCRKLTQVYK